MTYAIITPWNVAKAIETELKKPEFMAPDDTDIRPVPTIEPSEINAKFLPVFDVPTTRETRPQITIVPADLTSESWTRIEDQDDTIISVGIQAKVGTIDAEEDEDVGELMEFVRNVMQYLRGRELEDCPAAQWRKHDISALWVPDHLRDRHVFTSVFRLTYTVAANTGG